MSDPNLKARTKVDDFIKAMGNERINTGDIGRKIGVHIGIINTVMATKVKNNQINKIFVGRCVFWEKVKQNDKKAFEFFARRPAA